MGFFGLDHYMSSDQAADFIYAFKQQRTPLGRIQCLIAELKDTDFCYNTPGWINIALGLEDGVIRYDDLNLELIDQILSHFESFKNDPDYDGDHELISDIDRLEKVCLDVQRFLKESP